MTSCCRTFLDRPFCGDVLPERVTKHSCWPMNRGLALGIAIGIIAIVAAVILFYTPGAWRVPTLANRLLNCGILGGMGLIMVVMIGILNYRRNQELKAAPLS